MVSKRTNLIYGNCVVLSPEGQIMFRCLEERARWYLKRNLAIIKGDNPLTIQLTFQPKGNGEPHRFLKDKRENKCVVCGTMDLDVLTRHHLVPYEYRQFFPEQRKEHNSIFVVAICRDCHSKYESQFAIDYKKQLASVYNAPVNCLSKSKSSAAIGALNTLRKYSLNLPIERLEILKKSITDYLALEKIEKDVDFNSEESIKRLHDFLKLEESDNSNKHGKLVVERCVDLDSFELGWIEHFINSMNPKYLPDYLSDSSGILNRS